MGGIINKMETAIRLAIEGGYKSHFKPSFLLSTDDFIHRLDKFQILLDPLFWQALSKTEDWATNGKDVYDGWAWLRKWHDFIDHLASGGDIETFFKELLIK